jgi:hypothetical protein
MQNYSGDHPVSYPVDPWCSFLEDKSDWSMMLTGHIHLHSSEDGKYDFLDSC